MEYDDYSPQQYITAFWDINKGKNGYIQNLLKYFDEINSIDINKIYDKEYSDKCMKIFNDYRLYIHKIKGLTECLESLLKQNVFNRFEKYDDDFLVKISKIYNYLNGKFEKELSLDKFKSFMYENTAEGRIITQNNTALVILKQLKITEDCINSFTKKLNDIKLENSKSLNSISISISKESDEDNDSDNNSDNDSLSD